MTLERLAILICLLQSVIATAEKSTLIDVMRKNSFIDDSKPLSPYANLELRHYTNTYYDSDDYLLRQEPSAHVVAQLGLNLYNGYADLYATLGAVKLAQTQQVLQRRPQIELDIYPVNTDAYSLTQYTIVETPFSESSYDSENAEISRQGSIITLGFAQSLQADVQGSIAHWGFRLGTDLWTELYSRKQPRSIEDSEREQFSLARNGAPLGDEESEASPFNSEAMAGVTIKPHFLNKLEMGFSVHLNTKQEAKYYYDESSDELDFSYKKLTSSNYLLRLHYKLDDRVSFINDLYHFHDGFFAGRMKGSDRRRLRNVARMQVAL